LALERRNPLPPGRYWLDLFPPLAAGRPDGQKRFAEWVREHSGAVMVESTESFNTSPPRQFVIFRTSRDVPWGNEMGAAVGFPTKAPSSGPGAVRSSDDTVQRPSPEPSSAGALLLLAALVALAFLATRNQ
jgi:hypothetical protein